MIIFIVSIYICHIWIYVCQECPPASVPLRLVHLALLQVQSRTQIYIKYYIIDNTYDTLCIYVCVYM